MSPTEPLTMRRGGLVHALRDDDIRNTLCDINIGTETWHPANEPVTWLEAGEAK